MAFKRHPDYHVRLKNPNEARIFLDDPHTFYPNGKPDIVRLDSFEIIDISDTHKLDDFAAVEAAFIVLEQVVIPRAMLEHPPFPRHDQ